MRNFDDENAERRANRPAWPIEARQFQIGGETLAWAEVVPAQAIIGLGVAMKSNDPAIAATSLSDAILSMLDPSCHTAFYRALDARDENGIPLVLNEHLSELFSWLLEQASKRPPTPPSGSVSSPGTNGTASTGASPSPVPTSTPLTFGGS